MIIFFLNEQTDEKWKDAQYLSQVSIDNDNSLFIYTHDDHYALSII